MPRIFDFGGRDVERIVTVAGLRALKGSGRQVTQVTAETTEEAHVAEAAGIEMVVCRAANVARVREGSRRLFVTAALGFAEVVTRDDMLRAAVAAVTAGSDAVITGRSPYCVEYLAREEIPVVAHLGFLPRKSTWVGGVHAVGRTAPEALQLMARFREVENAGAFAAECELIAAPLMTEITRRSGLVTISLGSGPAAEVMFLFTADICGQSARRPRHARAWGNLAPLMEQIRAERLRALKGYRAAVAAGEFPVGAETAAMDKGELEKFVAVLEKAAGRS